MATRLALAGNPNSGKTTMFNGLTGSSQYVGNWPGVTVEKKEGKLRGKSGVRIIDLPGIYSLSPYTLEEVVTRNYLIDERPEVIINIVDASNIERNLYLTTQLLETGIPVVVALNMIDIVRKNQETIDCAKLSAALGCPVVETSAAKGDGLKEVVGMAIQHTDKPVPCKFGETVETALNAISDIIADKVSADHLRWYAVKLFERDQKAVEKLELGGATESELGEIVARCENDMDDDPESIITNERYTYVSALVKDCVKKKARGATSSDKIDRVLTNRWLALPIFALIMWGVYYISIQTVGDWTIGWVETLFEFLSAGAATLLENAAAPEWIVGLVVDGILGGVCSVMVFVPQMMILFMFLSILEDSGYMARVAFIMDRIFRRFGLSGKSFIPMLIGSGCGVPGIMATRTIENEKDRRMTIMLTTFIPCGAKLPIIALIAGAMFSDASWVGPSMYFLGVAMIIICGLILKRTKLFMGDPAPFVMELPQYHIPSIKGVLIHMWERGKAFMIKAGTIIFIACGIIWFLSNFGFGDEGFGMVDQEISILAVIGKAIAPIFAPLGFGNWQSAVATVTGLVAKENVVGTMGVLFGIADATESDPGLLNALGTLLTVSGAYAFMVFNMLCAPCFAAIGAIRREMASFKWTIGTIAFQTGVAYIMAFLIYQIGNLIF